MSGYIGDLIFNKVVKDGLVLEIWTRPDGIVEEVNVTRKPVNPWRVALGRRRAGKGNGSADEEMVAAVEGGNIRLFSENSRSFN
jgi:hypothetical protein